MSDTMLLSVAVFVFVMMVIGLGLTIVEFSRGQPRREDREAREMNEERGSRRKAA